MVGIINKKIYKNESETDDDENQLDFDVDMSYRTP